MYRMAGPKTQQDLESHVVSFLVELSFVIFVWFSKCFRKLLPIKRFVEQLLKLGKK